MLFSSLRYMFKISRNALYTRSLFCAEGKPRERPGRAIGEAKHGSRALAPAAEQRARTRGARGGLRSRLEARLDLVDVADCLVEFDGLLLRARETE
jgi:hypothetical protein